MKVALIQSNLFWEDVSQNLLHLQIHIQQVKSGTDLILLPEMFSTGFTMQPERLAEEHGGVALQWMQKMAKEKNATVCGSVSVKENNAYYNRLYWVSADGSATWYNKRHLFRMAAENEHYSAGTEKIFVALAGFNVCPLVCYDLRFPVWSRNRFTRSGEQEGSWQYDVLVYVANWPEVRSYPWKQLLIARAIENQAYVLAVNRVGSDGNNFNHSGDSMVVGPKGEVLASLPAGEEGILQFELDAESLQQFRKQFTAGLDADEFELT
jgi:predicted amidohydrolase